MGLFKRKATPSVSWEKVRPHLDGEEREIDASDGWIVGRAVGDSVDHPCSVFLTDRTIYVDVRPQTLMPEPELIAAPFRDVLKIGVAANHVGGTRLIFVFDTVGRRDEGDFRPIGVDLPPGRGGANFGQRVVNTVPPSAGYLTKKSPGAGRNRPGA
jgi:hypothetical protein